MIRAFSGEEGVAVGGDGGPPFSSALNCNFSWDANTNTNKNTNTGQRRAAKLAGMMALSFFLLE